MQSKRDQVQAHTFAMGRLTAGMLLADPDAPESPTGRTTRGVLIGLLVAVLISAGAFVYGLIVPGGNDSWQDGKSLIVNKDTGARYLYIDGRLRPVRNYASARLIGGADLKTTDVRTPSLRGTPVGAPVGIPGAPESVPAADDLDNGAWHVCSSINVSGTADGADTTPTAVTTLVVGAPLENKGVSGDQGLLVTGPDKVTYLVWRGRRLELDKASGAAVSLGYGSVTPRPVSAAFLDALVAGPDLASPDVPGQGAAGPSFAGRSSTVGRVYLAEPPGSAEQYYLLRKEGLVPLTATEAALVLGDPATREKAYGGASPTAAPLSADILREHLAPGTADTPPVSKGLPESPPRAVSVPEGMSACARGESADGLTRITMVLVPLSSLAPVTQTAPGEFAPACLPVDDVVVRPGHGALVRALGTGGTPVGDTTYLVADNGVKYRVPSRAALEALGYASGDVVALPSPLLSMLRSGPDLAPGAAAQGRTASSTRPSCEDATGEPG